MTGARMEISGREETLAFLGATIEKTDDQRGLFDAIGMALVVSTQQRFEDETDPQGNPWPDSLRKTLLGGRTLTDTAALVQSITHAPTDNSVAIGTNLIYAAIHQTGGTIKAKTAKGLRFRGPGNGGWVQKSEVTIPQRAFLGVDDEDENEIRALCADWLGAVDENGGGANAGR
jgi:phage virion morphogenesis protein